LSQYLHYDDTGSVIDEATPRDYKWGDKTYDAVLNLLMDRVSVEDISGAHVREPYSRLGSFQGVSKDEFKERMRGRRASGG